MIKQAERAKRVLGYAEWFRINSYVRKSKFNKVRKARRARRSD